MRLAVKRLINLSILRADTPRKHDRASTYMKTMVALIEHTHKNSGPAEAKLHGPVLYRYLMRRIRLGESEGMLPQEIFRKFVKFL